MLLDFITTHKLSTLLFISFFIISIFAGCSSGRFTDKRNFNYDKSSNYSSEEIRVLLDDGTGSYTYAVKSPVILLNENTPVAIVKNGNKLHFSINGGSLELNVARRFYKGNFFQIKPEENNSLIAFNGKRYHGVIKFVSDGSKVRVVNSVSLEDYVKGVVPAEMPLGRGDEYFQALKAFAICVRTYAVDKLKESNSSFDVYIDTRDQVYGGVGAERSISNRAVNETRNMILSYEGKPAIVYYSASCGGHTAKASNVFPIADLPYLRGVQDGDPPNCSIAPNFNWVVKFPEKVFIHRLNQAGLIPDESYSLNKVDVSGRFESGRVDKLSITLTGKNGEEKDIEISGNKIRYILKPPDGGSILRSTLFNIFIDEKNDVVIKGKGNGHGVGLCQWGALHLSQEGKSYKYILSFYFPGTEITELR